MGAPRISCVVAYAARAQPAFPGWGCHIPIGDPPGIQYLKSGGRNQVLALLLLCETALEGFFRCGNLRDGREYGSGVEGGAQYVGV